MPNKRGSIGGGRGGGGSKTVLQSLNTVLFLIQIWGIKTMVAFLNRLPDWEEGSRIRKWLLEGSYKKMEATSGHLLLLSYPNPN